MAEPIPAPSREATRPPRILHLLDHSLPLHSGYTFRTLSILHEQNRLGWETFHLTSPKQGVTDALCEDVDGWRFYRTPWAGGDTMSGVREWRLMDTLTRRLMDVAEEVEPDIIHAHSPALNAIPALRVGRHLNIPVVYEVRAFWEDAAVDHGATREGALRYRLTRALETWALKRADAVTTICEGLRQDIINRGIPAHRVTVIPNAVDVDRFRLRQAPDQELRTRYGLSEGLTLGFIGSFYGYEGLDILIEALPGILRQRPDTRLLLVGGGRQEHALRQLASTVGVEDAVVFAGRVPHEEVQRYYDLIDVLVYPRRSIRLTELVTPLKPLESMAQGHLMVASDVGGHRELIRDGDTGILFPAGNPRALTQTVLRLLDQRDTWPALRAAGRAFVEHERNWRASVARYRDVYGRLSLEGVAP